MNSIIKFLLLIPLIIASEDILDITEISYGVDKKQRIDLYKGTSDKVLVWIHGGGWLYGDKRAERWIKRFQTHFIDHKDFNGIKRYIEKHNQYSSWETFRYLSFKPLRYL